MDALEQLSALDIAAAIRERRLSSVEATQYFLDRSKRFNPDLGAFVLIHERRALRHARAADRAVKAAADPTSLPLFHGVPSGVKDLVPTRGVRTQLGSRAFRYFIPWFDGELVKRMTAGGFVSIGKLATSELGVMPITETDVAPPARNPWCPDRSSGGSSGGSSAAMAAGLLPIAHASDGGGSIRIPASFCHRFGFKPSLSLTGNLHGDVNVLGLSVMGPISHTVADAAAMLDVMAGRPHGGTAEESCLEATKKAPGSLRIGICLESSVADVHPEHAAAAKAAAAVLESLGHTVVEVPTVEASVEAFLPIWALMISRVPVLFESVLQPITRGLREYGKTVDVEMAKARQAELVGRIEASMAEVDILLTPTTPVPSPKIGLVRDIQDPMEAFGAAAPIGAFTALFNLTNGPAATHPMGFSTDGVPMGVQLGAKVGEDHLLFSLCAQLEAALPEHPRFPSAYA